MSSIMIYKAGSEVSRLFEGDTGVSDMIEDVSFN